MSAITPDPRQLRALAKITRDPEQRAVTLRRALELEQLEWCGAVFAAPASRIAHRCADGRRIPDARRIALVILEPDAFRVFGECVTRGWSEIPGAGAGDATVSGPIADAIRGAIRAHRNAPGADAVWIADTRGRTLARSVYPWNGAVRVSG